MIESLQKLLAFFRGYPRWAQLLALGGVLLTGLTLLFAPRHDHVAKPAEDSKRKVVYLTIRDVQVSPGSGREQIKLDGTINGMAFQYPGGDDVFVNVGPAVTIKDIPVPPAPIYELRFYVAMHPQLWDSVLRWRSEDTVRVATVPHEGRYEIHTLLDLKGEPMRHMDSGPHFFVTYRLSNMPATAPTVEPSPGQ